ncbi:MAG: transposase [Rivularia sp. (in: cyanobacteria)]
MWISNCQNWCDIQFSNRGCRRRIVIDVLNTHDIKLARQLYKFLNPLDILLGDRAFCAYADLFTIKKLDCDVVFRKHQSRKSSMKKGKIIGECDKIVTWYKPKKRPQGLSKEEFDILPQTITVREIYYCIFIPGLCASRRLRQRTQKVSLITTLLDKATYSTLDIVELYRKRWDVELDLRHLKTTLGMDILRCKTPSMIRKEIYVYLLAYNLLRSLMWSAGTNYGAPPGPLIIAS